VRIRALIHTHQTRTYILFCDKTRVPMFYFLIKGVNQFSAESLLFLGYSETAFLALI